MNKQTYIFAMVLAMSWIMNIQSLQAQYNLDACAKTDAGIDICNVEILPGAFSGTDGCKSLSGITEETIIPIKMDSIVNGTNVVDLMVARDAILNIINLTPNQIKAGDINGNSILSTYDLVLLSQLIVGTNTLDPDEHWIFFDENPTPPITSLDNGVEIPAGTTGNLSTNLTGVKLGDVNISATTDCTGGDLIYQDTLYYTTNDQTLIQGNTIIAPITLESDVTLEGLQFSILYDANKLEFDSIYSPTLPDFIHFHLEQPGKLNVLWTDFTATGLALTAGEDVFNLVFDVLQNGELEESLTIQQGNNNISADQINTHYANLLDENLPLDYSIVGIPGPTEVNCDADTFFIIPEVDVVPDPGSSCTEITSVTVTQNSTGETFEPGDTVWFTASPDLLFEHLEFIIELNCGATYAEPWIIFVSDFLAPIIICPSNISVNLDPGACEAEVNYFPIASDNCGIDTIILNPPSGTFFEIGTHTVTAIAVDVAGNVASCSFLVEVFDFPDPTQTMVCDGPFELEIQGDCNSSDEIEITAEMILEGGPYSCFLNYLLEVTDENGDPIPNNTVTASYIGQTIIAAVTDPNTGNSCWSEITITGVGSGTPFTCPPSKTVICTAFDANAWDGVTPTPTTADDVPVYEDGEFIGYFAGVNPDCGIIQLNVTQTTQLLCEDGFSERVYWAFDDMGIIYSCTQTILIENNGIPFFICDTLAWDAPVTDCDGGHSLEDGVEWPADVTLTSCAFDAAALDSLLSPENAHPQLFGEACALIGVTYQDVVVNQSPDTVKVIRTWTLVDWCQEDPSDPIGYKNWEYIQTILVVVEGCFDFNACAFTELDDPICNVNMHPDTTKTDETGCTDIQLTPPFTITPSKEDDYINGVSIVDLVGLKFHILEGLPLTPYQLIASDINEDGIISSFDLFYVMSLLLGEIDEFPGQSWRFVDADYVFPNPENPFIPAFPESVTVNFPANPTDIEFVGIKKGDLDASAYKGCDQDSLFTNPNEFVSLSAADQLLNAGESYTLTLHASNFENIMAFQLAFDFDPEVIEFDTLLESDLYQNFAANFFVEEPGKVNIVWLADEQIGSSLSISDAFLNIKFKALKNNVFSQSLSLATFPEQGGMDSDQTSFAFDTLTWEGLITTGIYEQMNPAFELQVMPNPMQAHTDFFVQGDLNASYELRLYDIFGRLIVAEQFMDNVRVERNNLAAGTYFYQVRDGLGGDQIW